MIPSISCQGLRDLIHTADRPMLIACLSTDYNYTPQLNVLNELAGLCLADCSIYKLDADDLRSCVNSLHIAGTPTFMLFASGAERGRLLGFANITRLRLFIERILSGVEAVSPLS